MKGIVSACGVFSVLLLANVALGQSKQDAIELTRDVIQTEKKAIVAANMQLTDPESSKFWPVYNKYQEDLREVANRRIALLEQFSQSYETMTDEKANELLKEFLDVQEKLIKTRKSWVKSFEKVLSKKKVARYYQIENKLETIIDYELATRVPLVR